MYDRTEATLGRIGARKTANGIWNHVIMFQCIENEEACESIVKLLNGGACTTLQQWSSAME